MAQHTHPCIALRVRPLCMGGNQKEKLAHASSSLSFYRKEKRAASSTGVHTEPQKPQGMEAGEGLSTEFSDTPQAQSEFRGFSVGTKAMWMPSSIRYVRSTRAVGQTMPARLTEPRPGGHHLFCKGDSLEFLVELQLSLL